MKTPARRLNVGGFLEGVPTWGTCEKCGAFFSVAPEYRATAELAREKLLADFDAHGCKTSVTAIVPGGNAAGGRGA